MKHDRPIGSKDKNNQLRKRAKSNMAKLRL